VSFVNAMFGEAAFTGFHIPAWIVRTKRRGMGALKKRNHPHGFELSRFVRTASKLPKAAWRSCEADSGRWTEAETNRRLSGNLM